MQTIKDGIALHLVRSPHYRRVHESSFVEAMQAVRKEMLDNRQAILTEEFRRRFGMEPAGVEALDYLLRKYFDQWEEYEHSGALLRVSIEQNFYRVRAALDELAVEVAHVPLDKELIISDAPAFTLLHNDDGTIAVRKAIGDSHGIALPVTRKCLVGIGPEPKDAELSAAMVDWFNRTQVDLAERQLYYRPGSKVKQQIDGWLAAGE